mmetsp:Transcript_96188/g.170765  ORF Transcript_96188/g.170765 Transcript_96188/m.170765 type:complete len:716 (-) Transcript_96188:523-2670(-)|eukprot:CAMPEP_0197643360 /NCGR_PEP_ID=MMETSP1338-20131121/16701_1 /TAXON_ID=43686 ORGANISM="Pelagodinium beii, Strain RCC1491" /NCGR_SAMPLE_ID=MMETSP1338 /ASSEMBLY_ACC=CAM_ASM_000754 /LENGTH=715 /DNA_ID=CAMNT_0043216605 /DNA_START=36 /DNA_END=2183 /DNA_ORIENTATION=-
MAETPTSGRISIVESRQTAKQRVAVVWYKVTDLRIQDHQPLCEAHASGLPVLHLYVFDPRWYRRTPLCKFPRTGSLRANFQLEALADLAEQLDRAGHKLCIRHGTSAEVFEELCKDFNVQAVFASHEVCSEELKVERSVREVLQKSRASLKLFWTFELHHYDDLPQWLRVQGSNSYTGYKNVFNSESCPRAPLGKPALSKSKAVLWHRADALPKSVEELGLSAVPPPHPSAELVWVGGETAALARVQQYLFDSDALALDYVGSTNTPREGNSCTKPRSMSRLSPWLAHGCLSPRILFSEIKRYERERHKSSSTYWLVHELYWRDFVRFQSLLVGSRIFKLGGLYNKHPDWPWSQDQALLKSWIEGSTGFPFLDASMREVGATGYCCHVGRETSAWFLICDLGLDWRMGAEWFESVLIDYEPAANWFCWVFVCLIRATGGNGFREVGHPELAPRTRLQTVEVVFLSAQHDPEGEYIKRWMPELRHLSPGLATREPWRATAKPSVADSKQRNTSWEGPDRIQMARRTLTSGGSSVAVWWSCTRKVKGQLPGPAEQIQGWPEGYPLPLFPPSSFFDIEKVADKARRQQAQKAIWVGKLRQSLQQRPLKPVKEDAREDAWDDFEGDSTGDVPQAKGKSKGKGQDRFHITPDAWDEEDSENGDYTGGYVPQAKGKSKGKGKDSFHITPPIPDVQDPETGSVQKRRWGRSSLTKDTPLAGM